MDPDLLSAIGSLASVIVAVVAAVVAYFAWRTAQNSAKATAALTEIERARWHADRRPEFELEVEGVVEDNSLAVCNLKLIGSRTLEFIEVVASIRDRDTTSLPGGEADFGPFLWDSVAFDEYYQDQIETKPFRMYSGAEVLFAMSVAPGYASWRQYSEPIRLLLDCTAENGDKWLVPASCRLTRVQDAPVTYADPNS
ncbi:hypothetical protein AB0M02_10525 [Actinoplanes sp. NPDC051861]|uniref:hypothetical protein n=1 Tax=Actinoplanes sp. NPDC051861 TaxID=3155170 RepID=UPI00341D4ADA